MKINRLSHVDPNLAAICGGLLSASLSLFPTHYPLISFFFAFFTALPLYFVGLSWGFFRSAIAIGLSFSLVALKVDLKLAGIYFITSYLPVLLIVKCFQKGEPAGHIVSWITGMVIGIFLSIVIILSHQSINMLDLLNTWFSFFKEEEAFKQVSDQLIPLIPGISSVSWILVCLTNAIVAQKLAMRLHLTKRIFPTSNDIQFYEHWDIVLAFSFLLALIDIPMVAFVGKNMALISYVPLFLLGLTVVYVWCEQFENPKIWVSIIAVMSISLVGLWVIIVMLGVLEPTLHLRQRWRLNKK